MKTLRPVLFITTGLMALHSVAQVANAGPDTVICANSYTMQASPVPVGSITQWTLVAGCGTIVNPVLQSTPIVDLCTGINTFQWTVEVGGEVYIDQMTITVFDGAQPPASTEEFITLEAPNNSLQLIGSPTPTFPMTCFWTVVSGPAIIAQPEEAVTTASGLNGGENVFQWTCNNGPCGTTSANLVVLVNGIITNLSDAQAADLPRFFLHPHTRQLHLFGGQQVQALSIADMQGRVVRYGTLGDRNWDLAALPTGVYLLQALVDDVPVSTRVLLEH
ncbi:MAG: T9SS type A sorting domain-containing protein [Flavobacteriales bacterium]|nr:T9SS type A sorting domain-containing protein [Flavobacteriales bacterium]